jgi:hypothetical protein
MFIQILRIYFVGGNELLGLVFLDDRPYKKDRKQKKEEDRIKKVLRFVFGICILVFGNTDFLDDRR